MKVVLQRGFTKRLKKLPQPIQELALAATQNPTLAIFRLHKLQDAKGLRKNSWAVRLKAHSHRAICERQPGTDTWNWYWVGTHEDYNRKTS